MLQWVLATSHHQIINILILISFLIILIFLQPDDDL